MASDHRVFTRGQRARVITVSGGDMATAPEVRQRLAATVTAGDTIDNLVAVTFLDSFGLRERMVAHQLAVDSFSMVVAGGSVTRLLELTGVDRKIPVFASLADAVHERNAWHGQGCAINAEPGSPVAALGDAVGTG